MNGQDPADVAEDMRAAEYRASLARREREREARLRALVGSREARRALDLKFQAVRASGMGGRRG